MAKKKKRSAKAKITKGIWTKSDVAMLKKLFPSNPTAMVAGELCRGIDAVKKKAARTGLQKTKRYMKTLGRG